jgi:hypothetical protein
MRDKPPLARARGAWFSGGPAFESCAAAHLGHYKRHQHSHQGGSADSTGPSQAILNQRLRTKSNREIR